MMSRTTRHSRFASSGRIDRFAIYGFFRLMQTPGEQLREPQTKKCCARVARRLVLSLRPSFAALLGQTEKSPSPSRSASSRSPSSTKQFEQATKRSGVDKAIPPLFLDVDRKLRGEWRQGAVVLPVTKTKAEEWRRPHPTSGAMRIHIISDLPLSSGSGGKRAGTVINPDLGGIEAKRLPAHQWRKRLARGHRLLMRPGIGLRRDQVPPAGDHALVVHHH